MAQARRRRRATPLAKLTRPRLHAAYPRVRLFRMLDALREVPAVWIAGPPGAGKTTLAASWLEKGKRPGIWYQLDAGDSDPATFFHYLREAAAVADPKDRAKLPHLTPEYLADVPGFARRWFRELFSRLPAGAVLCLDNYQEVAAGSPLHQVVAAACREVPDGAQLLVLSWADPPPEVSARLVEGRVVRVDPEALRLTLEEAKGIAAGSGALTPGQIREIHAQCDGWAAGFTLMRERARRTGLVSGVEPRGSMQEVFDYFLAQAFRDATAEERDTLVRTAFLPRFTEAMARETSGNLRAGELLERLYLRHLFVERRYGEDVSYEYHTLFRTFLLEEARRHYTPLGLAELSRRAAATLERAGMFEEAVQLLLEAGDHEAAARLVERLAPALAAAGRGAALEEWLGRLPEAERDRRPWLSDWLGAALTGKDLLRARAGYERAHAGFVRDGDRVAQAVAAVGVLKTYLLEMDDMNGIRPWLAVLEPLVAEAPAFPSAEVAADVYGTLVGLLFWASPHHPLLPLCVERLEGVLARPLAPDATVAAAGQLVECYALAGSHGDAARVADAVEPLLKKAPISPLARAIWWLRSSYRESFAFDFDGALRKLDDALAVADENAFHFLLPPIHGQRADVAFMRGDQGSARAIAEAMRRLAPRTRRLATRLHWVEARLAELTGDLDEALREIELGVAGLAERGAALPLWALGDTWVAVLVERGELDRARAAAKRIGGLYPPERFPSLALRDSLLAAMLGAPSGGGERWRERLGAELRRVQGLGGWLLPFTEPLLSRQLSEFLLSEGIEPGLVRASARHLRLRPSRPDVQGWPWAVRVRTLGRFGVELDDVPLTFAGKAPRKPLELLQAVVALGGRAVSAEALAGALWPDSDGDAASSALRMAASRLRKLLRRDDAVALHEGKLSLDEGLCWVDAWSLEALLREIEAGARPVHGSRLLDLYRGAFLEGEREQPWMLPLREKLRRRFVAAVGRLGEALAREGEHDQVIALCAKALDQEPAAEAIHRRLMSAHLALGRRAEALAAYRRCSESLRLSAGLAPSAETEALRREIDRAD